MLIAMLWASIFVCLTSAKLVSPMTHASHPYGQHGSANRTRDALSRGALRSWQLDSKGSALISIDFETFLRRPMPSVCLASRYTCRWTPLQDGPAVKT